MKRQQSEYSIHVAIADYLRMALPEEAMFFHVPNGGTRNIIEATKLKRMGTARGLPDILILWRSPYKTAQYTARTHIIAAEIKAKKGSLSKEQKEMHTLLTKLGCVCTVWRSVEECEEFLTMLMIPLKARVAA